MSIHVISDVLKCRDADLTSSRRMVLVALANYAGDDGEAWPAQQTLADESGCKVRSVKDHLKWLEENGFITRKTKALGQGRGSRTSYKIHRKRLQETAPDKPELRGADNAGAKFARANSGTWKGSIPPLTNRQEPSSTITNVIDTRERDPKPEIQKPKPTKRGPARQTSLKDDWQPTVKDLAYAQKKGLTPDEIRDEADRFRRHYLAKGTRWKDWHRVWQNWITSDFGPLSRKSKQPNRTAPGGGMAAALRAADDELRLAAQAGRDWQEHHAQDVQAGNTSGGGQAELLDADGRLVGFG